MDKEADVMNENKSYMPLLGAVILILALASVAALGWSAMQVQGSEPTSPQFAEIATAMEASAAVNQAEAGAAVEATVAAPVEAAAGEAEATVAAASPGEAAAAPVVAEATAETAATQVAETPAEAAAPAEATAAPEAAAAPAAAGGAAPHADEMVVAAITKGGCTACHVIPGVPGAVGQVGPDLSAIGAEAGTRVPGEDAQTYIHESLVNPMAFTAPKCPFGACIPGMMPQTVSSTLSPDEINAIVQYLLTLHGG